MPVYSITEKATGHEVIRYCAECPVQNFGPEFPLYDLPHANRVVARAVCGLRLFLIQGAFLTPASAMARCEPLTSPVPLINGAGTH